MANLLCSIGHPQFQQYLPHGINRPFYDPDVYGLTFGDQEADMDEMIAFLRTHKMTCGNKVLELFGGSAFESSILARRIKKNTYFSVDNSDYFPRLSGVKYLEADIFDPRSWLTGRAGKTQEFDVLFIGATNKSLCSIRTLSQLDMTANFISRHLKTGGYLLSSGFDDNTFRDEDDFHVDFLVKRVQFHPQYKGLWCHWGQVTHREPATGLHYYYPLIALTKTEKWDKPPLHYFIPSEPGVYKSWPFFVIKETFERVGLELIEHDLVAPNVSQLLFQQR